MPKPTEKRPNSGARFLEKSFPFAPGEGVTQERWDHIFGKPKPKPPGKGKRPEEEDNNSAPKGIRDGF